MNPNPVAIGAGLPLDSDAAIEKAAKFAARACRRSGYARALELVARFGIDPPDGDTQESQFKRTGCVRWWGRRLSKLHWRRREQEVRALGRVFKMGEPYCSDHSLNRWRVRKSNAQGFLGQLAAVNAETGEFRSLAEAAEHGLANPAVRRSELLARIRGGEEWAKSQGWRGEFWTLTTPPRFHMRYSGGGRIPKCEGKTPREAHEWLQSRWERWRAWAGRHGVEFAALRIVEAHHDGTPHFHILIFLPRDRAREAGAAFERLALEDDPPRIPSVRVKFEIIRANETAVGYVIKYVCKVIDGEGVGLDLAGLDAVEAAKRQAAWASLWGIRQFQFSGFLRIGPWRELRRVKAVEGALPEALVVAHEHARAGKFGDFLKHPGVDRIQIVKSDPEPGTYGDMVQRVEGVEFAGAVLTTREDWEILPLWVLDHIGVGLAKGLDCPGAAGVPPWTRFNNCTGAENVSSGRGASPAVARRDFQTERGPP